MSGMTGLDVSIKTTHRMSNVEIYEPFSFKMDGKEAKKEEEKGGHSIRHTSEQFKSPRFG